MESYSVPGFAVFYDAMVAKLPEEYEPGKDVELYWALLQQVLEARGSASVLDLCTGTGRVIAGLVQALAAQQNGQQDWSVRFLGEDNSAEMLRAAAQKLALERLPPGATCSWLLADMAQLPPDADLGAPFDLVVLSAGSFHHLLTRDAQLSCLSGVRSLLGAHRHARAIINLLPSSHLQTPVGSVTLAGGFRRECLSQERQAQPDGGIVWRQEFSLSKPPQNAAQEGGGGGEGKDEGRGEGGLPATQPAGVVEGGGPATKQQEEQQQEGWALREVEPEEMRVLLQASGLAVLEQRTSFGEGSLRDSRGRVFVVGSGHGSI